MKRKFWLLFTILPFFLSAGPDLSSMMGNMGQEPSLKVDNRILATVNGNSISVLDIRKRLDMLFHKNYPDLMNNVVARYQFYQGSWRHVLDEMINTELMIADSVDKELKVTDGEIHEEMNVRFGPNIVETLDKIGITEKEALKMVKEEMIVQRMMWFYVYQKAKAFVHPSDVRLAFQQYLKENPPKELWCYQVISIRGDNSEDTAEKFYQNICDSHKDLTDLVTLFNTEESTNIHLSKEYLVNGQDLSSSHKELLSQLEVDSYSKPITQKSRQDGSEFQRIFYLKDVQKTEAPTFDAMYEELKHKLFYEEAQKLTDVYMDKLKRFYGYEKLVEDIPQDFEPFQVQ